MRLVQLPLLWICLLAMGFATTASADTLWEKGRHYKELPFPVATNDPSKIEVAEAFWYGCPHCYEFNNKYLPAWEKQLHEAEDVDFVLVPATFPGWKEHAAVFYAAQELGVLDKGHQLIFDTIQGDRNRYKSRGDFVKVFEALGVSEEDYNKVFEATGFRKISRVDQHLKQADEKIKGYRLTGVPALIVNGKYTIGVRDAGGFANMIKIANYLIAKERSALQASAQ